MNRLDAAGAILGGVLVTTGVWHYSTGGALVVAGLLLLVAAFYPEHRRR